MEPGRDGCEDQCHREPGPRGRVDPAIAQGALQRHQGKHQRHGRQKPKGIHRTMVPEAGSKRMCQARNQRGFALMQVGSADQGR